MASCRRGAPPATGCRHEPAPPLGPAGTALIIEALTDNRNRTAPEIKKLFERAGGSMGAPGCVSWQFNLKAVFLVASDDEDQVLEALLDGDADAEDVAAGDDLPLWIYGVAVGMVSAGTVSTVQTVRDRLSDDGEADLPPLV